MPATAQLQNPISYLWAAPEQKKEWEPEYQDVQQAVWIRTSTSRVCAALLI